MKSRCKVQKKKKGFVIGEFLSSRSRRVGENFRKDRDLSPKQRYQKGQFCQLFQLYQKKLFFQLNEYSLIIEPRNAIN